MASGLTKSELEQALSHRLTSLKFLKATGLIPVKVRPGQKDPFPEWDPRTAANADHSLTFAELEREKDLNLGALFAGRYIDIDVDSNSPHLGPALDYFLPRTPYVWGRASKRRSHRVYALHEDFDRALYGPTFRYVKALAAGVIDEHSYSVEMRGGKPENGLFSVLPGSKHPSGERVEWDHEIDPTVGGAFVELAVLVRSVRLAVVSSIIAAHWIEGTRNDLSLALAGTLWRIRASTRAAYGLEPNEDPDDGVFVLTEEDAVGIFNCVMKLAGDDEEDRRSRILNLKNTWRKLDGEVSAKVTGGKVLAELIGDPVGSNVVRALYRLLSDNDAAEQIEKLAEQFAMWYGPGVVIDLDMVIKGRGTPWMTNMQARASMGGKNIVIGSKKVRVVDMLFNTSIIRRVYGLTFEPSSPDLLVHTPDGLMVNQWKGWAVEPATQTVLDEQIEPFLSYVREVVCSGVQRQYEWVIAWLADMFQCPGNKPGTSLVLVGVQGAGKTFLGEHVIGKIVGPSHYAQLKDITKLTDKFNTIIDNKIFVQCDEAIHSYQRDVASRLKSIISDGSVTIEPKGINAYQKPNHMRLLFTSNEETTAIFIDPSPYERRFTVLKVSPHRAQDLDYWSMMHLWTPTALPKIMRWLLDYKYDRQLVARPVETAAKRDIQRVGVDAEVSWVISRMASGFPIGERIHNHWYEAYNQDHLSENDKKNNVRRRDVWPDRIVSSVLEQDFKNYIRDHGRPVYSGSVMTNIRRVLPEGALEPKGQPTVRTIDPRTGQATQGRIRQFSWPTVEEIMVHLRYRYGGMVDDIYDEMKALPETDAPSVNTTVTEEF
jgi:hypothetical protein